MWPGSSFPLFRWVWGESQPSLCQKNSGPPPGKFIKFCWASNWINFDPGASHGGGEEPGDAADGHQVQLRRPLPLQPLQYQLCWAGGKMLDIREILISCQSEILRCRSCTITCPPWWEKSSWMGFPEGVEGQSYCVWWLINCGFWLKLKTSPVRAFSPFNPSLLLCNIST